jgi:Rab-like protein 2
MPVILVANKIDMDPSRASKSFQFVENRIKERGEFPFYFVSASDGSNVVTIFKHAIELAAKYKNKLRKGDGGNFVDQVMEFIREEEVRPDGLYAKTLSNQA